MRRLSTLRRVVAAALCAAAATLGVLATSEPSLAGVQQRTAESARGMPATLTESLTSAHFVVHYSVGGDPHSTTREAAAQTIERAERAWSVQVDQWGYPRPLDDGDGRVDIYMQDIDNKNVAGWARTEKYVGEGATGYIAVDIEFLDYEPVVPHELFHLVQYAIAVGASGILKEATANWAALRMGIRMDPWWSLRSDVSFDCEGACGGGHERWPFIEFLADRHGPSIVRELFEVSRARKIRTTRNILEAVLAPRGTTLEREYGAFVLLGFYDAHPSGYLRGGGGVYHGHLGQLTGPPTVTLNRLSTIWLSMSPSGSPPCKPTTLRVTVKMPPGVSSVPHFSPATSGGLPVPFAIADGVATGAIPWETCGTSRLTRRLMLTNASPTVDDAVFEIGLELVAGLAFTPVPAGVVPPAGLLPAANAGSTAVGAAPESPRAQAPPTAPAPAAPAKPQAPVAPAADPDTAPAISVTGRPGSARRGGSFRLRLQANGAGMLLISCRSLQHEATAMIATGSNVVSVPVPARARQGAHVCSLRSLSTAGSAGVDTLRLRLTVAAMKTRAARPRR